MLGSHVGGRGSYGYFAHRKHTSLQVDLDVQQVYARSIGGDHMKAGAAMNNNAESMEAEGEARRGAAAASVDRDVEATADGVTAAAGETTLLDDTSQVGSTENKC